MKAIVKKSNAKQPFTFAFVDAEGTTIVRSENYSAKKSALNGVESVKKNASDDSRYELKDSANGKFYFNLKASNGQVVGTSGMFASQDERQQAMAALKQQAASVEVDDTCG